MALKVEGLKKNWPNFSLSLDFTLERGEFLAFLGPSGSGKSTTLLLISGLLRPDSGSLSLDGEDLLPIPPHKRNIGMVFQDYALFPHLTVEGNLGYGLETRRWDKRRIKARIEELLALVRLEGYGKRRITELSGGEKQRVALARALAPSPPVLLLDEPVSALDESLRESMRREIKRIQKELSLATIYVTHDQEEALGLGDRICIMQEGRIRESGIPEDIFRNPKTLFAATFLGKGNTLQREEETVFFRPWDAELLPPGSPADFSGRLVYREYRGHYFESEVLVGGSVVRVHSKKAPPPLGTECGLRVERDKIRIFRSENQ